MSRDTRPSVTVIGDMIDDSYGQWLVHLADLPDIGLNDGDEVEVTIRRPYQMPSVWLEPAEADE